MYKSTKKEKTLIESTPKHFLFYAKAEGYEVKNPERKSERAAGIDVYLPSFNEIFTKEFLDKNSNHRGARINLENKTILINPQFKVLIPTGLHFNIPEDTYLDVGTKSGVFSRTGLKVGSHVVDSDYQGQVYISLFNTTRLVAEIKEGESLAQLIHKDYIHSSLFMAESKDTLYSVKTLRGDKGFGSTDESPHV
jgi:dUTP pyrophosphatase